MIDNVDDVFGERAPAPVLSGFVFVERAPHEFGLCDHPRLRPGMPDHRFVNDGPVDGLLDRALADLRRINDELGPPSAGVAPPRDRRIAIDFAALPDPPRTCRRAMLGTGRPCSLAPGHEGRCAP